MSTRTTAASQMPTIDLAGHTVSRLILGSNPINGGSHLSRFVNLAMKRYFTEERVLQMLEHCEEHGITCWQSGPANLPLYRRHREAGGGLSFISLVHDQGEKPDDLDALVGAGALAGVYHGELADRLFKAGKLGEARGYVARIRDSGMLVGISTHMPDVVDYVESAGWDIDFYMTCVYERHRTQAELRELLGRTPIPDREVYLEEDPPRMWKTMRVTARPCLAFKILAAGRLCDRQETVEEAFRATLAAVKPNDGLIIGIYPEYEDQVALDAGYVRRYG